MNKNDVRLLNEEILFKGFLTIKRYQLQHRLFAGGWSQPFTREVLVRERVGAALPYDPKLDKVVLLEQFRPGAIADDNPWFIEIVAGLTEANETPQALVHREAQEEANLKLFDLITMYEYWPSPGGSCEHVTLFCAKVDATNVDGIFGLSEENEDIRVQAVTTTTAFQWLAEGKIKNAATIIALQWLQINKPQVDARWLIQ